jgi:DNA-binding NtrC family response regulator
VVGTVCAVKGGMRNKKIVQEKRMGTEHSKVLLVDDNELTLRSMSRALQLGGVSNVAVSDPVKALDYYRGAQDMIVMTDYRMPLMNGLDLIKRVRQLNQEALCILYTGYTDDINQEEMAQEGVKFFSKPLNIESLIDYITINTKKEKNNV